MPITVNANGSFTVDTIEEALTLSAQIGDKSKRLLAMAKQEATVSTNGVHSPEADAVMLLRAGGYQQVKKPVLEIYKLMLSAPSRLWDAHTIGKRLNRKPVSVTSILGHLTKRKVIVRVAIGSYKVA